VVFLGGGGSDYLEGILQPKNPAKSSLTDPTWLNGSDSKTGPFYPLPTSLVTNWLEPASVCTRAVNLVDNFIVSGNNKITYNNQFPWSGPNSNSFTHSLLNTLGLAVPGGLSNLWYPGWSNTSVPFN